MGRIKRTYTHEQLGVATVDAALSVFPAECRQELRPQLLTAHRDSATTLTRRKLFREHDYVQTIAFGMNYLGPAILEKFNAEGAGATSLYFRVLLDRIDETRRTAHKGDCTCSFCRIHDRVMQHQS
jgi:hypothetical protein